MTDEMHSANTAYLAGSIDEVAVQLNNIARALDKIGLNGADTSMGGLELIAKELSEIKENVGSTTI